MQGYDVGPGQRGFKRERDKALGPDIFIADPRVDYAHLAYKVGKAAGHGAADSTETNDHDAKP